MRVLERPKSPLPSSVTRLIHMPIMPKLYTKTYRHDDRPLLLNDSKENSDDYVNIQSPRRQRKPIVSVSSSDAVRNAKSLANDIASNVKSKMHLKPIRYNHYGYSHTESRDDLMDEGEHLLTTQDDTMRVFRMPDLDGDEEREMPSLELEVVDFGGFATPKNDNVADEKGTMGTISVSDATDREEASIDSREYSKMYAAITRGCSESDESEQPSIVTECEETNNNECDESQASDDKSVGSVTSMKEMNDALQLNVDENPDDCSTNSSIPSIITDESSISARASYLPGSYLKGNVPIQLNLDGISGDRASTSSIKSITDYSSATEITRRSSYLHGLYLDDEVSATDGSLGMISAPSSAPSSVLQGVEFVQEIELEDELEVFTQSRSNSSDSGDTVEHTMQTVGREVQVVSPLEDPICLTPQTKPCIDSPSDGQKRPIVGKLVVVTPSGERIVPNSIDSCPATEESIVDNGGTNTEGSRSNIDLKPKYRTGVDIDNTVQQEKHIEIPTLVSVSSGESSSSESAPTLSFSGLKVHNFDDDVFDAQCDNKSEGSDFNARDDWKPQEDTGSTCSEPFGCCTINVDVKHTINGSREVAPLRELPLREFVPPASVNVKRTIINPSGFPVILSEEIQSLEELKKSFEPSDDWLPQEDGNGSDCSQPFGSTTDYREMNTPIPYENTAVPVELSPPCTPRKVVPFNQFNEDTSLFASCLEINLIDIVSDESEYSSSDSNNSSRVVNIEATGSIELEKVIPPLELSPPNTPTRRILFEEEESPRFVYPEINMLDMSSDESESDSSSNSSVKSDSFRLSDRFKDINEYTDETDSNESFEPFNDTQLGAERHEEWCDAADVEDTNVSREKERSSSIDYDNVSVLNESNRSNSGVSEGGAQSWEALKNFWALEWFGVANEHANEHAKVATDFNDTTSATDSERTVFNNTSQENRYEYTDIDSKSFRTRSCLSPVDEETVDESQEDKDLATSESLTTTESKDGADSLNHEAENSIALADTSSYIEEDELNNTSRTNTINCVVFRFSRFNKKNYIRVKKLAVVKAKSNKSAKFSIVPVNREPVVSHVSNNTVDSDVDEVVKKALSLISKRLIIGNVNTIARQCNGEPPIRDEPARLSIIASDSENDEDRLGQLSNYLSPKAKKSSLGDVTDFTTENDIVHVASLISEEPIVPDDSVTDRELEPAETTLEMNYSDEPHKEITTNEVSIPDNLDVSKEVSEKDPRPTKLAVEMEHISSEPASEENAVDEKVYTEEVITSKDDQEQNPEPKKLDEGTEQVVSREVALVEKSTRIDLNDQDENSQRSPLMKFDDVHPPELGTLTQKLYYTNTELAETLAVTQSELAMANKRVETLASELQLLAATKAQDNPALDEEQELVMWVEEKNSLID